MQDLNGFLLEWTIRFLKNKDIVRKEIIKIENKDAHEFTVHYKDKIKFFILMTYLEKSVFDKIDNKEENYCLVTLNNKANAEFVVNNWKELSSFSSLGIYFLNPFSKLDKVWVINPYVHDKICDMPSLRIGITAMSEMVEGIDERAIEINLKSKGQEPGL